jgi:hypothetical protein
MRDWDEVVNEVDRPDTAPFDPSPEPGRVETCMTNIEVEASAALIIELTEVLEETGDELAFERMALLAKKSEQVLRSTGAENAPQTLMLDYRL